MRTRAALPVPGTSAALPSSSKTKFQTREIWQSKLVFLFAAARDTVTRDTSGKTMLGKLATVREAVKT